MNIPHSSPSYVIAAYVIGLGLLWGYAALLGWEARASARRRNRQNSVGGKV